MTRTKTYLSQFNTVVIAFVIIAVTDSVFFNNDREDVKGYDKPEGFTEFFYQITTPLGQEQSAYPVNYRMNEYHKAKANIRNTKANKRTWQWTNRGPGNVGGRTRDVLIDPDDPHHNTWFAAAASGGVWKTEDGGVTWINLNAPDTLTLAANTLAMAPSNHNVLYVGTGEGYGGFGMVSGNGIFRSSDRGANWDQLYSTANNKVFRWINKILVDKNNADIILVATNTGIYKSFNAGIEWDTVFSEGYAVQDLEVNPDNYRTVYAGVNGLGVIKSYQFGDSASWFHAYTGMGTGYRHELTVSSVDTNTVYASVEAPGMRTHVYQSTDGAGTWYRLYDADYSFVNFLGVQGWFNNTIKAHPLEANKLFIGGVHMGSIEFSNVINYSEPDILRIDTFGTGGCLGFVNFGGHYFRGALATGLDEGAEVEKEDYVSVVLLFDSSFTSKAHRFTVPEGEGPGVPEHLYTYRDYVTVPFQAWDVDNNKQLMVSFRDQDRNGIFNLTKREWDDNVSGREYIFIHQYSYDETQETDIARDGGHYQKMLYFVWPTLPDDSTKNTQIFDSARLQITYGRYQLKNATTQVLADDNRNPDLHVDHHDLEIALTGNNAFMILDANDGGLGISHDNGETWEQIRKGYHTTQFYGVAKKKGAHEYIGGMQDNGTWQSPAGEEADSQSEYLDRVAGDGFEALWHPEYPSRILASSYYNQIELSIDGGRNWSTVNEGISGGGPFITRLSHSAQNPNLVFAVGNYGVYRHKNFCVGRYPWQLTVIDSGWAINNVVTSSHNVEVSLASPAVVWAGGGMHKDPDLNIFVSTDYGETFNKVNAYNDTMGYITSMATHPTDSATAYLLFSISEKPKILRTTNLGETWEDISGFSDSTASNNGFPDVMTYSLMVFPDDTTKIWVGTEIGIFESIDNGDSWHLATINFPPVSVWQMFIQDHTIVVATHGRGIFTTTEWPAFNNEEINKKWELSTFPNPSNGIVNLLIAGEESDEVSVDVYNISGIKQFSISNVRVQGRYQTRLDFSDLVSGTYFISVHSKKYADIRKIIIRK